MVLKEINYFFPELATQLFRLVTLNTAALTTTPEIKNTHQGHCSVKLAVNVNFRHGANQTPTMPTIHYTTLARN